MTRFSDVAWFASTFVRCYARSAIHARWLAEGWKRKMSESSNHALTCPPAENKQIAYSVSHNIESQYEIYRNYAYHVKGTALIYRTNQVDKRGISLRL